MVRDRIANFCRLSNSELISPRERVHRKPMQSYHQHWTGHIFTLIGYRNVWIIFALADGFALHTRLRFNQKWVPVWCNLSRSFHIPMSSNSCTPPETQMARGCKKIPCRPSIPQKSWVQSRATAWRHRPNGNDMILSLPACPDAAVYVHTNRVPNWWQVDMVCLDQSARLMARLPAR